MATSSKTSQSTNPTADKGKQPTKSASAGAKHVKHSVKPKIIALVIGALLVLGGGIATWLLLGPNGALNSSRTIREVTSYDIEYDTGDEYWLVSELNENGEVVMHYVVDSDFNAMYGLDKRYSTQQDGAIGAPVLISGYTMLLDEVVDDNLSKCFGACTFLDRSGEEVISFDSDGDHEITFLYHGVIRIAENNTVAFYDLEKRDYIIEPTTQYPLSKNNKYNSEVIALQKTPSNGKFIYKYLVPKTKQIITVESSCNDESAAYSHDGPWFLDGYSVCALYNSSTKKYDFEVISRDTGEINKFSTPFKKNDLWEDKTFTPTSYSYDSDMLFYGTQLFNLKTGESVDLATKLSDYIDGPLRMAIGKFNQNGYTMLFFDSENADSKNKYAYYTVVDREGNPQFEPVGNTGFIYGSQYLSSRDYFINDIDDTHIQVRDKHNQIIREFTVSDLFVGYMTSNNLLIVAKTDEYNRWLYDFNTDGVFPVKVPSGINIYMADAQ